MTRTAAGWVPSAVAAIDDENRVGFEGDGDGCSQVDDSASVSGTQADCATDSAPLDSQQAVDAEAAKWAHEWQVGQLPPLPVWPAALGDPLPAPCLEALVRACKSFPIGTGLGWDHLRPRALVRCSRQALVALLRLFFGCSSLLSWWEIGRTLLA